ncbi:CLUMA_CG005919, isoform A [Clunio marinus]|uniref:CLUMA_CG005919, isoform A n=1 Tax=Clunio marinus TaxID=568069 RepID=A0A1J1HWG0_9DIPT|nr:CLUMA_CG005919, isoform A [Clunio marinus]
MSTVRLIETSEDYKEQFASSNAHVVLYGAEWAEQCNQILTVMEQLAKQDAYKDIKFLNVAIEEIPEVAQQHEIEAVPTVILFQNNKAVHRIDGIDIADLTASVKTLVGTSTKASSGSLEERLKSLINKGKVVLFMKGDRNAPRCGFSKQIIQILNETNLPYETFDILSDEEVRQGLKTYSDWPTYPQLYVNGELQGGLDIVKELVASGELLNILKT